MKVLVISALLSVVFAAPNISQVKFNKSYQTSGRIINGEIAKPHSIPSQVFLEVHSVLGKTYCSGTLITENTILTAGQCIHLADIAIVTLGAQNPFTPEDTQVVVIARDFISHAGFSDTHLFYDIGLIKLARKIKLTDAIQLAVLPTSDNNTYVGKTSKASGWGDVDYFGGTMSEELRYFESTILINDECQTIPDYKMCVSVGEERSICLGDAGGPLTVDGVQVGIASSFNLGCKATSPIEYIRVSSFLDWIAEFI